MPYPGQPKDTPIPPELDRWNWGAFLLNWIWGLGNSTYIALLMFVPIVNIVMIFVLGAKGSQWAWKNQQWASDTQFLQTQRNWALAGFIVVPGILLLIALGGFGIVTIMSVIKNNDAYKMSISMVQSDEHVIDVFGQPVEAERFISGNVSVSGSKGEADFSIPIFGPKCEGDVISEATKEVGTWIIHLLVVLPDCQKAPIVLINKNNVTIPNAAIDT